MRVLAPVLVGGPAFPICLFFSIRSVWCLKQGRPDPNFGAFSGMLFSCRANAGFVGGSDKGKVMTRLSIIVVERDRDRALKIVDGLMASGDHNVVVIAEETGLARRIAEQKPDIVLIDIADPSRDVLEELALVSGPMERPVAIFVDRSDEQLTRAAIEAGVSAYVVDGLQPERIKPILDAAIARFHMFQKIRAELAATKAALEERKIIDRAKAILMKARGIDEEAAYALLRKTAMDQKRRVADIAQQLVMAAGLLT
jgi:two-component system, response regulator / RNA-binding antiterminator